jgi:Polysaccharide lyase family 4, domain III/Polysaccharide lyase family 4, domain II/Rhamnogalacturonate lyase family
VKIKPGFFRISTWLALGIMLSGIGRASANVPGGGDAGPPVTLSMSGKNVVLANGIVTATIEPDTAKILSLRYQGYEMVGQHKHIYFTMTGDEGHEGFPGCVLSVKSRTPDMVDVSCKSVYSPQRPNMFPCDADIHFVLRRGMSGLYAYAVLNHPADYPTLNLGIWRMVWQSPELNGQWTMEKLYLDDARHWAIPTPTDVAKAVVVGPKEVTRLTTGAWQGQYDCKYMYNAPYWDLGCWGFASDRHNIGEWLVFGSHEFFNDGPTMSDLTACTGGMLVLFKQTHYNGSPLSIPRGKAWQKIYGPILIYCNASPEGGDACWADAKRQAWAEQAAWPYTWLTGESLYPLKDGRGTVTGRFIIQDHLKADVSGAVPRVGLAQFDPDENQAPAERTQDRSKKATARAFTRPRPAADWQFESRHYQYWVHANADGDFSIPNVRPGNYTLYAFTTGEVGEFSRKNVEVKADQTTATGNLTWAVPHPGASIAWEIGVPDRTAREFRHGNDYFRPYLWQQFAREFSNPLDYTVGASDWSKDWNYAQCGYLKDGVWTPWKWRIHFALTNVPTAGDATLIIAYADANRGHTEIYVNDENRLFKLVTPAIQGGNALIREGIHAKYCVERVPIPVSRLKTGANTITLVVPPGRNNLPFSHVMYDYLDLELPAIR